ncbi:NADH-ubiquinone oxidoreductase 75 kDa subunit, mitochondrial-like [Episyrphus balteatus]|uniref:NADH-ubiquinone oxidoreductase 75 kDa subunit, mitochondrial-like n=1 Tax=Episyrphus balteatus TaxID=286459 RepID=UPI002485E3CF|nr:NADH-ubiquinone oxidoreductase 75 kDa subunit, mitochondrial-like [Episyrphus balteatus]
MYAARNIIELADGVGSCCELLLLILRILGSEAVLLVGTNPRYEAPLLNTRLHKGYVHNELDIALIGSKVEHLGNEANLITQTVCIETFSKIPGSRQDNNDSSNVDTI